MAITKCGGARHGNDPLDVYIARHRNATTNESRYQVHDATAKLQYFCSNPPQAREVVQRLKAEGHRLTKNPKLHPRPNGETVASTGTPKSNASPAAVKMVQDLFSGKVKGANVGIEITITVNGKPIKIM